MRRLLVVLVVLGLLLVGVDLGAKMLAERKIGDEIAQARDLSTAPGVDIGGFPFLVQAWRGQLSSITVHSADLKQDDIELHNVRATLTDVDAPIREIVAGTTTPRFTAARAQVQGTVDYASLAAALKARAQTGTANQFVQLQDLSAAQGPDGAMLVKATATVMGAPVSLSVPVKVGVDGGRLTLSASGAGDAVQSQAATQLFNSALPIPKLPYGLTVQRITAEKDGLTVSATASGVSATS